jgi:hypothetical protein
MYFSYEADVTTSLDPELSVSILLTPTQPTSLRPILIISSCLNVVSQETVSFLESYHTNYKCIYVSLCMLYSLPISVLSIINNGNNLKKSRISSGSIVSDYGLDDRAIGVRSPAGAKDFSPSLCVQTGSGAHPASCTMGTGGPFPGGKSAAGAWRWPLTPF